MRIRQVKPAFWSDVRLAELSEGTRLFYIGLWMIADDAGWLRWDPSEVARDLYGYEVRRKRELRVKSMFERLAKAGRVKLHECGHAEIPKMPEHQHLAGTTRQVRTVFNEHTRTCISGPRVSPRFPANEEESQVPASPREEPQVPAQVRLGNGQERLGQVRSGKVDAREPTEFETRVPRSEALK